VNDETGPLDDAAVAHVYVDDGGALGGAALSPQTPGGAARALVLTMDVITPIVDDPRAFGGIAASNALSDVYAMGGQPELALSFVGFPSDKLPIEVLGEILQGMRDVCEAARCAIVGGHTLVDPEPKCGLSVTGSVDPRRVWSHKSARAGHALVLSKRIGTGVAGQSIRAGKASSGLVAGVTAQMLRLNDTARDVGLALGATSCTDVTGFGLLGHLRNIVEASDLTARLRAADVPLIEGVRAFVEEGVVPGGTKRNLKYAAPVTAFATAVPEALQLLLADAQTSGGLLLCLPEANAAEAVRRLLEAGCDGAAVIGALEPHAGDGPRIFVE
jgi:selenide,water dikinase